MHAGEDLSLHRTTPSGRMAGSRAMTSQPEFDDDAISAKEKRRREWRHGEKAREEHPIAAEFDDSETTDEEEEP